jgi:hypothetical protein
MGQRRQHHKHRRAERRTSAPAPAARPARTAFEIKPPVTYGKPFTLLEDTEKVAFIYSAGQWVRFEKSIAECRVDCLVKELPQKINGMTRYEVAAPT